MNGSKTVRGIAVPSSSRCSWPSPRTSCSSRPSWPRPVTRRRAPLRPQQSNDQLQVKLTPLTKQFAQARRLQGPARRRCRHRSRPRSASGGLRARSPLRLRQRHGDHPVAQRPGAFTPVVPLRRPRAAPAPADTTDGTTTDGTARRPRRPAAADVRRSGRYGLRPAHPRRRRDLRPRPGIPRGAADDARSGIC